MTLQIHHAPESGTITVRWRFYNPQRDVLVGFVGADRKFSTTHPFFDHLHGAAWGENVEGQISERMKGAAR